LVVPPVAVEDDGEADGGVGGEVGPPSVGAVQALASLGYAGAAAAAPSKPLILTVALFENFAAGLGSAAFVAFLMSVCERRYAATQYAVLSALLALTRSVAGRASGDLAEAFGYAHYFLLTFLMGLPAFGLLPWVRRADDLTRS
jgi:PAT family beta-lactamase induction signal transducer AmpG